MVDEATMDKKKYLFIVNDSPYGIERPYNAFRLAMNLAWKPDIAVSVFMMGDGVFCAKKNQKTPDGYYNLERMVGSLIRRGRVAA
jgi:uncharacterized protein involved in oxidation of intracellular sulfur